MDWRKLWPRARREHASPWAGIDYLDLVPRRVVGFEAPANDTNKGDASEGDAHEGEANIVLLVPRYRDRVWGRLIQPRLGPAKRFVRVPLEARGSALWRAMDGQRTVRDLMPAAHAAAPDDDADLARRVCLYVQNLADNGFIRLTGAGPADRLGT